MPLHVYVDVLLCFLDVFVMSEEKKFPLREAELPWKLMEYNGIDINWLQRQHDLVETLRRGLETSALPIYMREQFTYEDRELFKAEGRDIPDVKERAIVEGTARVYIDKESNEVKLLLTSKRPFPDLREKDSVYMGHKFTEEDIFMLLSTNSIGRAVELTNRNGEKFEAFVGMHPITNAMRYMRVEHAVKQIPEQVCGHTFTPEEMETLKRGDVVKLTGLQSRYNDKTFDSYFMYDASTWNTKFLSENTVLRYQKERGVISKKAPKIKEIVGVVKSQEKRQTSQKSQTISAAKDKGVKKSI